MSAIASELWRLMPGGGQVDPAVLAGAIVRQIDSADLDFRTRLLIRDSLPNGSRFGRTELLRCVVAV